MKKIIKHLKIRWIVIPSDELQLPIRPIKLCTTTEYGLDYQGKHRIEFGDLPIKNALLNQLWDRCAFGGNVLIAQGLTNPGIKLKSQRVNQPIKPKLNQISLLILTVVMIDASVGAVEE